ncbi:MAG: Methyltransferase FkbM family [Candidatus Roizmanbacteria bacterium GW2011_GWA2_36_23]|uniref:Methyltransferase FkbM family n=1 Tax=Candidatus Roizmanbacteria bacterium GW2011_GWA2_36_23 TaxID=1618480 RepID=A0A0G0EKR0_9BACT|nr:MAG: Methyltransferase FkbM family [Candidatus Roizmanbacteria bacterium GW2011_GWA2_36_23]
MTRKIIYSLTVLLRLIFFHLRNPVVLFGYLFKKPVRLDFKNGISLLTLQPLDAIVSYETIIQDSYKVINLRLLYKSKKRNRLNIVDLGAGLGDFSIFIARKYPDARIIAIEPNNNQYELLKKNLELNKVKNVLMYNLAVGTKSSYNLNVTNSNVHASTVNISDVKYKYKVKGQRLDRFMAERIDFLKIDCEGAEIDILNSISPRNFKKISLIVAEYHNHIIENEDKKIIRILKENGFKVKKEVNPLVVSIGYISGKK